MVDINAVLDARGRKRYQTVNTLPSMTKQADAKETDIKVIVQRATKGVIPELRYAELQYADISELTDFSDAMRVMTAAKTHFMTLPPEVRKIFNNDVAIFLDTANDKEKQDALAQAGFIPTAPTTGEGAPTGSPGPTGTPGTGTTGTNLP